MFVLEENPTFTHSVTALVPVDGGHDEQMFDVTYNVLDAKTVSGFDLNTIEGTDEFLRAIIARLGKIAGKDGNELPYSDGLRDRVIMLPWARTAIANGFFTAVSKGARGN